MKMRRMKREEIKVMINRRIENLEKKERTGEERIVRKSK
jgi:hypothetical protein